MIEAVFGPDGMLYIVAPSDQGVGYVRKIDPKTIAASDKWTSLGGKIGCPTPSGWK